MSFKKKLAGTATAAAVFCSLFAGQVFAAAPEGAVRNSVLNIEKVLYTDGSGHMAPNAQFDFKIEPFELGVGQRQDGLDIKKGKELVGADKIKSKEFSNGESTTEKDDKWSISDNTAQYDFAQTDFEDKAAIYRYKVTENQGKLTPITYDDTAYQLDVYVNNSGDVTALVAKKLNEDENATEGNKVPIKFENTYSTEDLSIEKKVEGITGEKEREFNFTLKIEKSDCLTEGAKIVTMKHSGNSAKEDVELTVGQETAFKLKSGEKLALTDLPAGTVYTVKEKEANTDGYTTVVAAKGSAVTNEKDGIYTIQDGENAITVTNTRNEITPTGIILNIAPYAAALLLAVVAAVFFVVKRKNSYAK